VAIEGAVIISARVSDVRSAQQTTGLLFFPFVLLYIASVIGVITLDTVGLLEVAAVLAVVALGLFSVTRRTFDRENILIRWK
jgi:hypothetical protein